MRMRVTVTGEYDDTTPSTGVDAERMSRARSFLERCSPDTIALEVVPVEEFEKPHLDEARDRFTGLRVRCTDTGRLGTLLGPIEQPDNDDPVLHMRWDDHDDTSRGFSMVSVSDLLAGDGVELA